LSPSHGGSEALPVMALSDGPGRKLCPAPPSTPAPAAHSAAGTERQCERGAGPSLSLEGARGMGRAGCSVPSRNWFLGLQLEVLSHPCSSSLPLPLLAES
jgi:hypothetical protein